MKVETTSIYDDDRREIAIHRSQIKDLIKLLKKQVHHSPQGIEKRKLGPKRHGMPIE